MDLTLCLISCAARYYCECVAAVPVIGLGALHKNVHLMLATVLYYRHTRCAGA